jgi:hypothetical protein
MLLATGLFPGQLAQVPVALPLERVDAASGHDERFARIGRQGCKVDLTQVDGGLHGAWGLLCLWHFDAHVQFKAAVPHEGTGSARLRKIKGQNQRGTPADPSARSPRPFSLLTA